MNKKNRVHLEWQEKLQENSKLRANEHTNKESRVNRKSIIADKESTTVKTPRGQ